MLFVRVGSQVESRTITTAACAFIAALSEGASLLEAGESALVADPTCALNQIIVTGLALGLFTHLASINRNSRHDH